MKTNKFYKLKRDLYEGDDYFGRLIRKGEIVFLVDIQFENERASPHFSAKFLTKNGIEYIKDLSSNIDFNFEEFVEC